MADFDDVCVMIPWRATPSRAPLYKKVDQWYRQNLGIAPIPIDSSSEYDYFNVSNARNRCVESAPKRIIVLTDADSIPDIHVLKQTIEAVRTDYRAHLPYTVYRTLTFGGTTQVLRGKKPEVAHFEFEIGNAISGVQVTTREIWESHNGQDERFRGWGFEDTAWYEAHSVLLGSPIRHDGILYALNHQREWKTDEWMERNGALMFHYQETHGDPEKMRQILYGPDPRIGTYYENPGGPVYARPGRMEPPAADPGSQAS